MLAHLFGILAQTGEPVPSVISAGGTAAAVVFSYWFISLSNKEKGDLRDDNRRLQEELRATNDKTLAMAEKAIPALVEATRTLGEVKASMDSPHRSATGGAELDRLMRQLERLAEDMKHER